jgi:DMSO/TMAO reductase YedYZ molybdopterin-dependent catalytic subunit
MRDRQGTAESAARRGAPPTLAPTPRSLPGVVRDASGLEPGGLFHPEELQLALRNRALPLEALRYERTPTGLHYTLTHYDIPFIDAASFSLIIKGRVKRPLCLGLADLKRRVARTIRVTLECAGDGRALLQPRPISQPWLSGAVGTADWTAWSMCSSRSFRRSACSPKSGSEGTAGRLKGVRQRFLHFGAI